MRGGVRWTVPCRSRPSPPEQSQPSRARCSCPRCRARLIGRGGRRPLPPPMTRHLAWKRATSPPCSGVCRESYLHNHLSRAFVFVFVQRTASSKAGSLSLEKERRPPIARYLRASPVRQRVHRFVHRDELLRLHRACSQHLWPQGQRPRRPFRHQGTLGLPTRCAYSPRVTLLLI